MFKATHNGGATVWIEKQGQAKPFATINVDYGLKETAEFIADAVNRAYRAGETAGREQHAAELRALLNEGLRDD